MELFAVLLVVAVPVFLLVFCTVAHVWYKGRVHLVPGATRPGGDGTEEREWEEANRPISLNIAAGRDNTDARRDSDA